MSATDIERMYSDPFGFTDPPPSFVRTSSVTVRQPANSSVSQRPRSMSVGTKATVAAQPSSPYLQRIASKSSPLLSTSATGKKGDVFDGKRLPGAAGNVQVNLTGSRYKTELCRPFQENGTCKYGDRCQFAHGVEEIRTVVRHPKYKTELCRTFHSTGFCPYGPRCHFVHNPEEAREANSKASKQLSYRDVRKVDPSPPLSPVVDSGISSPSANEVFHYTAGGPVSSNPSSQDTADPVFVFPSGSVSDNPLKSMSETELVRASPPYCSPRGSPTKFDVPSAGSPTSALPGLAAYRPPSVSSKSCSLEEAVTSGLQQLQLGSPYSAYSNPFTYTY